MSLATCAAQGDRKVTLTNLSNGSVIDSGNSCDKASDGYVFVQNGCTAPVTVGIQVRFAIPVWLLPCHSMHPNYTMFGMFGGVLPIHARPISTANLMERQSVWQWLTMSVQGGAAWPQRRYD